MIERHSLRKKNFDYSQPGVYFVTVCVENRLCLFGHVVDGEMKINDAGEMIRQCWFNLPNLFPSIEIDSFIIMPNHIHAIIHIVGAGLRARPGKLVPNDLQKPPTISDVLQTFKSFTTHAYMKGVHANKWQSFKGKVWQRSYYDSIVTNIDSLENIREYILNNPTNWKDDTLYSSIHS